MSAETGCNQERKSAIRWGMRDVSPDKPATVPAPPALEECVETKWCNPPNSVIPDSRAQMAMHVRRAGSLVPMAPPARCAARTGTARIPARPRSVSMEPWNAERSVNRKHMENAKAMRLSSARHPIMICRDSIPSVSTQRVFVQEDFVAMMPRKPAARTLIVKSPTSASRSRIVRAAT